MNFFTFTSSSEDSRPVTINLDKVNSFYPASAGKATVFEFDNDSRVFVQQSYAEVLTEIRKKE